MENRIRELRKAQGLTLKQVAKIVGTSDQQISHLEKGRRRLTAQWMERLAEALNCHPADLLAGSTTLRNEKERIMLELFRGLSQEQQEAFLKATAALAQPLATSRSAMNG